MAHCRLLLPCWYIPIYTVYIYIIGWKLENATTFVYDLNLGPFSACHQLTSHVTLSTHGSARKHCQESMDCCAPKKQAASGDHSATWALGLAKFCPRQIAKRTSSSLGRDSGGPSVSLAHPPDLVGGSSAASDATAFTKMSPILHRFQRAKSDIPNCSAEMGCKMGCQRMRRTPCPIWDPLPNKTFSWFELVDIPDVKKNKQQLLNQDQGWPKYMGQDKPLWASVPSF